jgi:hypothetical protein
MRVDLSKLPNACPRQKALRQPMFRIGDLLFAAKTASELAATLNGPPIYNSIRENWPKTLRTL